MTVPDIEKTREIRDKVCQALEGAQSGEAASALGMVLSVVLKQMAKSDQEMWIEILRRSLGRTH